MQVDLSVFRVLVVLTSVMIFSGCVSTPSPSGRWEKNSSGSYVHIYGEPDSTYSRYPISPYIGMTKEEAVESNWGSPNSRRQTSTSRGRTEMWIFSGGAFFIFNESGRLELFSR